MLLVTTSMTTTPSYIPKNIPWTLGKYVTFDLYEIRCMIYMLTIYVGRTLGQMVLLATCSNLTNCQNDIKVNFPHRIQHYLEKIPIIKSHISLEDDLNSSSDYTHFLKKKGSANPF